MQNGNHALVSRKYMFKNYLWRIRGLCHGNDPGRKQVVIIQLVGVENVIGANDVRNLIAGEPVIAKVVTQQTLARPLEFPVGHFVIAVPELLSGQKFTLRRRRDLETLWDIELLELGKDRIAKRLFGVAEHVEAKDPAANREADQQQNRDGPEKQIAVLCGQKVLPCGRRTQNPAC